MFTGHVLISARSDGRYVARFMVKGKSRSGARPAIILNDLDAVRKLLEALPLTDSVTAAKISEIIRDQWTSTEVLPLSREDLDRLGFRR